MHDLRSAPLRAPLAPMPLPNRVSPFAEFVATPARGLFMGNRGRIHDGARRLGRRRWASPAWICCQLAFKQRRRTVWGEGYTELFFLDEPTALAAGHRPCFECRRAQATAFAAAWAQASGRETRPRAGEMDQVLHGERVEEGRQRRHGPPQHLPDGVFVVIAGAPDEAFAVRGDTLMRWTASGYAERLPLAGATIAALLTPPSSAAALARGYAPQWHPSAE
jgi:hypothetical protein